MCGRFTLTTTDYESLAEALGVTLPDPEAAAAFRPRYNVAPTDLHLVLRRRDGARQLLPAKWGLVNSWARDPAVGVRQINARSETARTKPAFRDAFERRRCVVPADGFLEWTGAKDARRPIWYHPPGGGLLLLAGLYESYDDAKTGARQRTFTILTTAANDLVAPAHDRMPAILSGADVDAWLDAEAPDDAAALLRPAPLDALVATAVSPRVNSVKNDDPACLEPAPEPQPDLFAAAPARRTSSR